MLRWRLTFRLRRNHNTLSRAELEDKARRLAAHQGAATADEMKEVIARVWRLHDEANVRDFLPARELSD